MFKWLISSNESRIDQSTQVQALVGTIICHTLFTSLSNSGFIGSQDPFSLEIAGLRQKEKYLSLDTACEFSSKVKYWFSNLILLFIEILIGTYGFDCLFVCVVLSIDTIYWIA